MGLSGRFSRPGRAVWRSQNCSALADNNELIAGERDCVEPVGDARRSFCPSNSIRRGHDNSILADADELIAAEINELVITPIAANRPFP